MELLRVFADELAEKIDNAESQEEVRRIVSTYKKYELKGTVLGHIFEKLFVNDGFSEAVLLTDLEKIHHSFHTTNGGDWCRSRQSYLGKKYIIKRVKKGGRIYSVKCDGPQRNNHINASIRQDIVDQIKSKKCVILNISSNIECDHKEGKKDDSRLNDLSSQKVEDFQPLCKTANDAKRSHCKRCIQTGKRFDAKKLGYKESFIHGDEDSDTCVGCYWYDPKEFNKKISENFIKRD